MYNRLLLTALDKRQAAGCYERCFVMLPVLTVICNGPFRVVSQENLLYDRYFL
jgi:hypothetical protein